MESGVVPVPVMDITKGYKVTQSVMDLIEQKHGSNMFSGKVEQAWMDIKFTKKSEPAEQILK